MTLTTDLLSLIYLDPTTYYLNICDLSYDL